MNRSPTSAHGTLPGDVPRALRPVLGLLHEIGLREGIASPYAPLRQFVVSRSMTESPGGACGLETRPAIAFPSRRLDDHEAARGSRGWIPEPGRSNRHDHTGRSNDDADGRGFCGVRTAMLKDWRTPPETIASQQAEIRKMVSKGDKTDADAARLFKTHSATVCRLLARSGSTKKTSYAK